MTDWAAWSREAVRSLQDLNARWVEEHGTAGRPFQWHLDCGSLAFDRGRDLVTAAVTLIGTTSKAEGTFLWAWANDAIPEAAKVRLDEVRAFGERHDLGLLIDAEWKGGRAEGLEMLAVAARVLDARGAFVDEDRDRTFFFVIRGFEIEKKKPRRS